MSLMRINPGPPTDWKDLQKQVALILSECGLTTEVEKSIATARGSADADVHALDSERTPVSIGLCECKHWEAAVPKGVVRDFRTVMGDFGANWGYIVAKNGFQSGAFEVAKNTNVKLLTWDEFESEWQLRWADKHLRPQLRAANDLLFQYLEPMPGNNHVGNAIARLSRERQDEYWDLRRKPEIYLPSSIGFDYGSPFGSMLFKRPIKLPFTFNQPGDAQYAPTRLLETDSLREFGNLVIAWAMESKRTLDAAIA